MVGDPSLFLDTCLVIAATVEAHPGHAAAAAYVVRGKQVHDCNIVATMRVHGVRTLATRNASDFKRYGELIEVVSIS